MTNKIGKDNLKMKLQFRAHIVMMYNVQLYIYIYIYVIISNNLTCLPYVFGAPFSLLPLGSDLSLGALLPKVCRGIDE